MRAPSTSARGFTMIEMIVVIVVVGAIFGVGALALGRAFESYDLTQRTTDTDWQGRVALERMARELRDIRSRTAADLDVSVATQLWFIDVNGNGVCFYRDGATSRLMRSSAATAATCTTAASSPLADNVAAGGLNFFNYDQLGNPNPGVTNVSYISVTLNVVDGNINETYRTTVQPRRF